MEASPRTSAPRWRAISAAVMAMVLIKGVGAWKGGLGVLGAVLEDVVAVVQDNDAGFPFRGLVFLDLGVAHDGEEIAGFAQVGGGAVKDDAAAAALALDDVGFEAVSVGQVAAEDAFIGEQAHPVHEGGVDGEAAFV